jgi:hypothetical protein
MRKIMSDDNTVWDERKTDFTEPLRKKSDGKRSAVAGIIVLLGIILIFGICFVVSRITTVQDDQWAVRQHMNGDIEVIEGPGVYLPLFSKIWIYPLKITVEYKTTAYFNDTEAREVKTLCRVELPEDNTDRVSLHKGLSGDIFNVYPIVRAAVGNSIKSIAPIMSTNEIVYHRRAEFCELVYRQLKEGLFLQHSSSKIIDGKNVLMSTIQKDENGDYIPMSDAILERMGLNVSLFSITSIGDLPE